MSTTMKNKTPLTYPASLHNDLCDVINTMGPPTPMLPLDSARDDTTITSNYTQSSISDDTNTSFVEVIIKNHHKNKKIKVLEGNRNTLTNKTVNQNSDSLLVQHEDARNSFSNESEKMNDNINCESDHVSKSNIPQLEIQSCPHFTYPCQRCCPTTNMAAMSSNNFQDCKADKSDDIILENNISKTNLKKVNKKYPPRTNIKDIRRAKTNEKRALKGIPNIETINGSKEDEFIDSRKNNVNKCPLCSKGLDGLKHSQGLMERTELYYFDHGNSAYYHTTDCPPVIFADYLAEKTENAVTRFWAQIFGMANLVISLLTSFILQLTRFILFSMVRPLTVGLLQIYSDYFVKPLLSVIFNAFIQPPLIFIFNVLTSIRDLCEPIAQSVGFFLQEIANVLRAFRLVEYNNNFSKVSNV